MILVLVAVSVLAANLLSRVGSAQDDQNNTMASLKRAAAALDAFAGMTMRLPCPANPSDPSGDVGVEITSGLADCQYRQGTLPWKTIGLSRSDAYDAWGHKISYRVYLGSAGSLVQAGGASMADCDTNEAFPTAATGATGGVGGLCQPGTTGPATSNPDPTLRTTPPSAFLAGKGLQLFDFGVEQKDAFGNDDVAYVLISHGLSGLGSYSSSGVQLPLPSGDEKDNTKDTGPFHIEAFSAIDTKDTSPSHFDDLLVYRTISDLATKANLAPRNWPDTVLSAITFDKNTLAAALGSNPHSDTGQTTIALNNVTVSAFNSSGAQDIAYDHGGGDPDAIGGVSGSGLLQSGGDGLQLDFAENARQFAFTVESFNTTGTSQEQVQLQFYTVVAGVATLQNTIVKPSCSLTTQVESFSVDAGSNFNRVVLSPIANTTGGASSLALAEVRTCVASVSCVTSLAPTGVTCP
ncbi:MAG TPA: hypothetical protein VKR38_04270 [Usitatibacter sp.]|nr:hypothetical protein [Usitatibacter sp.]